MRLELAIAAVLSVAAAAPAADAHASRFTYYDMLTPLAGPCDLTTGPDGAIWASDLLVDKIARIDPKTGVVEEFAIPYSEAPIRGIGEIAGRGALACGK
jgi:streptogramin lyase